jgi:hypothetical protein
MGKMKKCAKEEEDDILTKISGGICFFLLSSISLVFA